VPLPEGVSLPAIAETLPDSVYELSLPKALGYLGLSLAVMAAGARAWMCLRVFVARAGWLRGSGSVGSGGCGSSCGSSCHGGRCVCALQSLRLLSDPHTRPSSTPSGYSYLVFWHSICPLWQQVLAWAVIGTGYFGVFQTAVDCAHFAFWPTRPLLQVCLFGVGGAWLRGCSGAVAARSGRVAAVAKELCGWLSTPWLYPRTRTLSCTTSPPPPPKPLVNTHTTPPLSTPPSTHATHRPPTAAEHH
jgi:hypothetical protein